ncbi:MAG: hypothetical protein HWD61_01310 [Parachlamydiaceae bacterium]|nr:MAG: hypothetical protein HWD61_01310 [Parachlamydiaceae bacterium]
MAQILKAIDHTIEHSSEETKRIYKIFVFDKLARFNTQIFNREILNKVDCSRLVKLLDEDYQSIDVEADFTQDENYLKRLSLLLNLRLSLVLGLKKSRKALAEPIFKRPVKS